MSDITVCTPVGVHHTSLIPQCVETVKGQTITVKHLIGIDTQKRGAGYVRNALLRYVDTPMVVFLDVDDLLYPTFVERCLQVIQPNSYVYTAFELVGGHRHGAQIIPASPNRIWQGDTWHVVTTLLWTDDVKRVGGFDPHMPALEDTDFYVKLLRVGCVCPIRVTDVLFKYVSTPNSRSKMAHQSRVEMDMLGLIMRRYGHKMACCGKNNNQNNNSQSIGLKQVGDVLVQAQWHGNTRYIGKATRRVYGRLSYPIIFWCDPADAEADKSLVKIEDEIIDNGITPVIEDDGVVIYADDNLSGAEKLALAMGYTPNANTDDGVHIKPDVDKVVKLGKKK